MTPPTLKQRLQRFVLWSSGSPLGAAYQGIYRLLIRGATAALGRHPSVRALYLCRGCAKDDITPGISDIDLVIVIDDDSRERAAVERTFRALGRATGGVVDFYPALVQERSLLERRWRTSPAWQYRFLEGRSTWRLLHGADVLAALPPLSKAQRRTACWAEMNRWWLTFARHLLATSAHHDDVVTRSSVCHKTVSELLDVDRALRTGEPGYSRSAALARSAHPLAKKLEEVAARRFLADDERLLDETLLYLFGFFTDLWSGFAARPFVEVRPGVTQRVDFPDDERGVGAQEAGYLDAMERHAAAQWRAAPLATRLVKSALWGLDDWLLVLDIDGARPPSVREIAGLTALHARLQERMSRRVFAFLRLGSVGFPITPVLPPDWHRGLLTPATTPDVFLQLGAPEVCWSDYTRWYLCDWETNERWPGAPAAKQQQLAVIARGAERGAVIYPLSEPAIARARR